MKSNHRKSLPVPAAADTLQTTALRGSVSSSSGSSSDPVEGAEFYTLALPRAPRVRLDSTVKMTLLRGGRMNDQLPGIAARRLPFLPGTAGMDPSATGIARSPSTGRHRRSWSLPAAIHGRRRRPSSTPRPARSSSSATSPTWCRPVSRTAPVAPPPPRSSSRCRASRSGTSSCSAHGRCGGIRAALHPEAEPLSPGDFIGKWMKLLGPAASEIAAGGRADGGRAADRARTRLDTPFAREPAELPLRLDPRGPRPAPPARRLVRHRRRRALDDESGHRRLRQGEVKRRPPPPRRPARCTCFPALGDGGRGVRRRRRRASRSPRPADGRAAHPPRSRESARPAGGSGCRSRRR